MCPKCPKMLVKIRKERFFNFEIFFICPNCVKMFVKIRKERFFNFEIFFICPNYPKMLVKIRKEGFFNFEIFLLYSNCPKMLVILICSRKWVWKNIGQKVDKITERNGYIIASSISISGLISR